MRSRERMLSITQSRLLDNCAEVAAGPAELYAKSAGKRRFRDTRRSGLHACVHPARRCATLQRDQMDSRVFPNPCCTNQRDSSKRAGMKLAMSSNRAAALPKYSYRSVW